MEKKPCSKCGANTKLITLLYTKTWYCERCEGDLPARPKGLGDVFVEDENDEPLPFPEAIDWTNLFGEDDLK